MALTDVGAYGAYGLASSHRNSWDPSLQDISLGFRVASVPEPSYLLLTLLASRLLVMTRRKHC